VVADRQDDRPVEGARHRRQPASMDETVRADGGGDTGQDAEQTERRPGADQRAGRLPRGQRVDDAPEQHRLGELHQRRRQIGQQQADHDARLGPQHGQRAADRRDRRRGSGIFHHSLIARTRRVPANRPLLRAPASRRPRRRPCPPIDRPRPPASSPRPP
jgi:hypothetical protein